MTTTSNFQLVKYLSQNKSDLLGSLASGICLIHCLATPFLFMAHLEVGHMHDAHGHEHGHHHGASPFWWQMIDVAFLAISFLAVFWSAKNSTKQWMKIALYASWAFLAMVIINEKLALFHWVEEIIYLPTLALIGLHLYNRRYCCENDDCLINEKT